MVVDGHLCMKKKWVVVPKLQPNWASVNQPPQSRHITGKFEIVPLTFFATYDDRGGFAVQFGFCSVKIR